MSRNVRTVVARLRCLGLTYREIDRALWGRRTNGTRSFLTRKPYNKVAAARRLHVTFGLSHRDLDVALFGVRGNGTRSLRLTRGW